VDFNGLFFANAHVATPTADFISGATTPTTTARTATQQRQQEQQKQEQQSINHND
jgi:hypothetical protein